jgi:hypothetical protein
MKEYPNLGKFKLGFGPMSLDIINLLVEYSLVYDYKFMIIASRNQVDFESSYVCSTETLSRLASRSNNILLCRDHCGPYFKDSDIELNYSQIINKCKQTILTDIQQGFKLIHVDVSRVQNNAFDLATELIDYAVNLNPNILIEFGSEENTGLNLTDSIERIDTQLEFCKKFKNISFFVTQTGSSIRDRQIGNFDINYNLFLSNKIHNYGFLFKEHNGDYLDSLDLKMRKTAGIDAINIAPQLGTIQTKLLFDQFGKTKNWIDFANIVYDGKKFNRWISDEKKNDKLAAVLVSGHYFFNTKEYLSIFIDSNEKELFYNNLRKHVFNMINLYRQFHE